MTHLDSKVLIVDDHEEARWVLRELIKTEGLTPIEAASGEEALTCFRRETPDLVLLDVWLPQIDGFAVLGRMKALQPIVPVIMVTGNGRAVDAVRAMKAGAHDYLTKPFHNRDVALTIRRALEDRWSKERVRYVPDVSAEEGRLTETMGPSALVERLMADVTRVAPTTLAVLVTGETGAGKELVARAIHANSGRARKPLIAVDCGAIPESLIERELFGHEKGAFTGAHQAVPGAFEMANGGTLFLDEIGNLPLAAQGKLLRVLEERRIRRIGGTNALAVDFRVVAATNVDLREMVDQRAFRQDLYHRLAEFRMDLPPLRERKEDIPHLVKRFMELANRELGKNVRDLSAPAMDMILAYDWPGNVRELRNQLRRAMLFVDNAEGVITPECLEMIDRRNKASGHPRPQTLIPLGELAGSGPVDWWCKDCPLTAPAALLAREGAIPFKELVGRVVAQVERSILIQVLKQANGNKAEAARLLRIDYKTIHSKLKEYGISTNPYKGQTEIKRKTQAEEVGHGR